MTETLTDVELEVVFFIERFATTNGMAPTREQINMRFTGLDDEWYDRFEDNPLVQKTFKHRGINFPPIGDQLTPEQMHAVAVMSDLVDRRSDEKKLRDLGISTRQWATWLQNDVFAEYLRNRSEKMVANSAHEIHRGLMKGVRNGNVASVKLAYELTGRFQSGAESQIDVRRILHMFIEVIQRYVRDPVVLHNISMDLTNLATQESYTQGTVNGMLGGAQDYRTKVIAQSSSVPDGIDRLSAPSVKELEDG